MLALLAASEAAAQESTPEQGAILEFRFRPTHFAQLALWIEREDGTFLSTVRLTEAVASRGIGNRPGASQMNGGFRWPYGRREGVLPVWAAQRASAPGARQFRRVIFQNRAEGFASQAVPDHSRDDYYCLSFIRSHSRRDALDAISCASVFNSDKGRFITEADVAAGYAEPYERPGSREPLMRPLSLDSLYPPRRDVSTCTGLQPRGCFDHPDVDSYAAHAREVMPDIDAVTMATPEGGVSQAVLYPAPADWEPGTYRACLEINVEGDYNDVWNDRTFPTPQNPDARTLWWDDWALDYGYPYRGQPSVVYCAEFELSTEHEQTFAADEPSGSTASWDHMDPTFGTMLPMEGMSDDPVGAPGSGADRLLALEDGSRLQVVVRPALSCMNDAPPSAVGDLHLEPYRDERHAHEWAHLRFTAAEDDRGVHRYDVRVSTEPITDAASFMAAVQAKQATIEAAELLVPTDIAAGELVEVELGGLAPTTEYFIAVRAIDGCAAPGPIRSASFRTPKRVFATVSPCFVATAAWGTPLAQEVAALRRVRDRHLLSNALGRAIVSAYYAAGPALAELVREHEGLRSTVRRALRPAVELARWLDRP